MRSKNMFSRILAMSLAAALVLPVNVFADQFSHAKVEIDASDGDVTRDDIGDVTTTADDEDAVFVGSYNGYTADVETGNLYSENNTALWAETHGNGSSVMVDVNGDAVSSGNDQDYSCGVIAMAEQNAEVFVDVHGNASGVRGVDATSAEGSTVTVIVDDSATGLADNPNSIGVVASSQAYDLQGENLGDPSEVYVGVNGSAIGNENGVWALAKDGSYTQVTVTGDVISSGEDSTALWTETYTEGISHIDAVGDVHGEKYGIIRETDGSGITDIMVMGTVYGEKAGIATCGNTSDNDHIFVWKVETGKDGYIAATLDENYNLVAEDTQTVERILYIIKIEQPEGGTINATNSKGEALDYVDGDDTPDGRKLELAHQNDKILVKINVEDGYRLDAVYGDKGQKYELARDCDGNYYVIVPKGGGVYLSAALTKLSDENSSKKEDPVVNTNDNTAAVSYEAEVANAVSAINATPAGGSVSIVISDTKISSSIVSLLLARRDINVSFVCMINGKMCSVMIPAGVDLSEFLNPDGTINLEKLIEKFGTAEV